ncbi:hypothetical protein [Rathayibacter rathayi]|uniref:hypothetical protein n=1 Tax=Rathayibacter rathayi TaxID=33887 RepID=UPI000BCC715B|nr:hypothetical protein [Rathayibacter rathayi]MWV73270.1 hypothetical protein [Rathayibacter rathayi NCPPB 2980 = VKM Ac-1601]PPG47356.1 hypothetical protein C5C20_00820 [Rathayibacter rathayi]TWD69687.1 hypothetical protein FB469_1437 [Rathayibacter rathayi]SOE05316.1 hypothetical protein SAMN06295924_108144 [Rathayibacter rathayi NCPPB 2980 = VKM Ac-1601]
MRSSAPSRAARLPGVATSRRATSGRLPDKLPKYDGDYELQPSAPTFQGGEYHYQRAEYVWRAR